MSNHPIRVIVTDDLERNRLTVFFRLLLAIPHYFVVFAWTILALIVAVIGWIATLLAGRTPSGLHAVLERYVRYLTHVSAYLLLTAAPYPGFLGRPGYPVDLEVDPPARQHRGKTAVRILLALPALALANTLVSAGGASFRTNSGASSGTFGRYQTGGVATSVAVLAWFVCVARARMPRGLRDLQGYALRYTAQTWGYVLLLTDRYPDARPADPPAAAPDVPHPVALDVRDDLIRSRLTVFFRILLALPHIAWLVLWTLVMIPVSIVAWLSTLVLGRLPGGLYRVIAAYLRYQAQLSAFIYLVSNPFPGFTGGLGYPVELRLPETSESQSRWRTLARAVLALPALVIAGGLGGCAFVAAVLGWFASLINGRMPVGLRDLGAWSIRYSGQVGAYFLFVTERYPYAGAYEFAEPASVELPAIPG